MEPPAWTCIHWLGCLLLGIDGHLVPTNAHKGSVRARRLAHNAAGSTAHVHLDVLVAVAAMELGNAKALVVVDRVPAVVLARVAEVGEDAIQFGRWPEEEGGEAFL